MKVAENIFFYEGDHIKNTKYPYRGIGSSNFLIITGDEVILIDSGMPRGDHRKRQSCEMKKDGTRASRASHILFSHIHPDHTLHAKNLCKKKNVKFHFHEENEFFARRDEYLFLSHYNYPDFILEEIHGMPFWFVKAAMKKIFGFDYIKISRFFSDGEVLDFGCEIEIIHLPSHFPGHVGFYFPKQKVLYSADLFDLRVADCGIINNALSSYEQVFADIEKIRKYDTEILIPGHGPAIYGKKNIEDTLDKIEQGTRNFTTQIMEVLTHRNDDGATINDMLSSIFQRSNAYNASSRKIILYNTLMYLKNLGNVDYAIYNKRALWHSL